MKRRPVQVRVPHRHVKTEKIGAYSIILVRKEHDIHAEPRWEVIVRERWHMVYHLHDATMGAAMATFERAVPILEIEVAKEAMGLPTQRVDLCFSLGLFPSST